MDIENIKKVKSLAKADTEELKKIKKPIGKAIYKQTELDDNNNNIKNVSVKEGKLPTDIVECTICDKKYTRSNKTAHCGTKYHQLYMKMNKKLRQVLIDE